MEKTQNIPICETEPYQALAKEIVGTCMEENLEPQEVIKAIKAAFLDAALSKCNHLNENIDNLQSEFKKADSLVQLIRKA
jgi:hypothetical protein